MWMKILKGIVTDNLTNYDFTIIKNIINKDTGICYDMNYENKRYLLQKNTSEKYSINYYDDIMNNIKSKVSIPGGVICDEVGLEKTLSTVSHIVTQLDEDKNMKKDGILKYDINNLLIIPAKISITVDI